MTQPMLASYFNDTDGDGRFYRNPFTGQTAVSVTSVLKMANKDGMKQWYVDMALKAVIDNPDGFFQRDAVDFFKGYRFAAENFRDERAEVWTEMHGIVEALLTDAWDTPQPWDQSVIECVDQFKMLQAENEIIPWAVETTLWNEEWPLAGTADFIGWVNGKFGIWDSKTARKVHRENLLQLAMLKNSPEVLRQVPEGTEGAVKFEKEETVKGQKFKRVGWFVREELPEIEEVGIFHCHQTEVDPLTGVREEAFHRLVTAPFGTLDVRFEELDVLLDEARGYHIAYSAQQRILERRKQRDQPVAVSKEEA